MEITNLTREKIDTGFLEDVQKAAQKVLGKKGMEDISLVFVCDGRMQGLNKKFRKKDKTTDVLSFDELNEIFICLPQAKRQAKLLKTGLKSELTRLFVHGIVHLKGFDHEKSAKDAERMFAVEKKILNKI